MTNLAVAIPIISLLVAIAGFSIMLLIAVRNRTIIRPRVAFAFRAFDEAYPKLPRRLRRKRPEALFIYPPKGSFESDLQVPIGLRNRTKRRIEGITIELTYPAQFFLSNQELMRRMDGIIDRFGDKLNTDRAAAERFLRTRDAYSLGPSIRVRYNPEALRSGENFIFSEPFILPPRPEAFTDGLFEGTAFSNVLLQMQTSERLRAAFHLKASIFTDLAPRQDREIDVILCTDESDEESMDAEHAYVDAYWLGAIPGGRTFRRSKLNVPWLAPPLMREAPVDVIKLQRDVKISEEKDGWVAVATSPNPLKSQYGVASLFLPGYNPRRLADTVTTAEQGLLSIGYVSVAKAEATRTTSEAAHQGEA